MVLTFNKIKTYSEDQKIYFVKDYVIKINRT